MPTTHIMSAETVYAMPAGWGDRSQYPEQASISFTWQDSYARAMEMLNAIHQYCGYPPFGTRLLIVYDNSYDQYNVAFICSIPGDAAQRYYDRAYIFWLDTART